MSFVSFHLHLCTKRKNKDKQISNVSKKAQEGGIYNSLKESKFELFQLMTNPVKLLQDTSSIKGVLLTMLALTNEETKKFLVKLL